MKYELKQYCDEVINNDIAHCLKYKWSAMRFLRDLRREETDEFPWLLDEEKAKLYFNWMRLFKHSKGPLAGKKKEPAFLDKAVS